MAKKVRIQNRIPGVTRVPAATGLLPDVERLIRADMRRFGCSRAFVLGTIATQHYERVERRRFPEQARYDQPANRQKLRLVSHG